MHEPRNGSPSQPITWLGVTWSPRLPGPSSSLLPDPSQPHAADTVAARKSINAMANVIASARGPGPMQAEITRLSAFPILYEGRNPNQDSRTHSDARDGLGRLYLGNHDCNLCASPPASATLALTIRQMIKRRSSEHSRLVIIVTLGGGGSWESCVPRPGQGKPATPVQRLAPETSHCLQPQSLPTRTGPLSLRPDPERQTTPDSTQPGPEEFWRRRRRPRPTAFRSTFSPVL